MSTMQVLASRTIKDNLVQVFFCTPEMDAQCVELDAKAEMSVYLCGLVRFGRNISIPYHQIIKHKGYDDGFVLVARIKDQCIGKVAVAIRNHKVFDKAERAAYIFDMRIDVAHQRGGVGRLLYDTIEKVAAQKGCTMATCFVNYNNTKSINFFLKTNGFNLGSERQMLHATSLDQDFQQTLKTTLKDGSTCEVSFLNKTDKRLVAGYDDGDCAFLDMDEMSRDRKYIGMFKAQNGSNQARLHLYESDKQFGMVAQRIILQMETWRSPYVKFLAVMLMLAGPIAMIFASLNYTPSWSINNKVLFGFGVGLAALFVGVQCLFSKALRLLSDYIRVFGYQFKGNSNQEELLKLLNTQARRYASSIGAATVRLNQDIRAPYLRGNKFDFNSLGSRIISVYLYKYFDQTVKRDNKLFKEKVFFDPRI